MSITVWCNGRRGICTCDAIACDDCKCCDDTGSVELSESLLAYIRRLEAQVPRWVNVEERLPEIGVTVLTLDRRGHMKDRCLYAFEGGPLLFRPDGLHIGKDVTHWMPLPEGPKEDA